MKDRTKINQEFIDEACKLISHGMNNKDVCDMLMVSEKSFYHWRNQGDEDIKNGKMSIHRKFSESLKIAQTKFKAYHISQINKATSNDWKASAWMLERKFTNEYGRFDRAKIEVTGNLNVTNRYDEMSDAELERLISGNERS